MMSRMIHNTLRRIASFLTIVLTVGSVQATDQIQIVHGQNAAPLEKLAASELVDILNRVFSDIDVRSGSAVTGSAGTVIHIGNPASNSGIAANGFKWPELSDQGIVILSNPDGTALAVGGGSPAATLWAVYELGNELGIQYLLRGDLNPIQKRPFSLSSLHVVREPRVRQRGWETIGSEPFSFESWGLDDQKRLIHQLAKLKFNHLILKIDPWHPFVHYEFGGVSRSTATFFKGIEYPLTGDVVGRKAFSGARSFHHPDIPDSGSIQQRFESGRQYLAGILKEAQRYGMTVSIQLRPGVFPVEFSGLLPGSKVPDGNLPYCVLPPNSDRTNSKARELSAAEITACFESYPEVTGVSWPNPHVNGVRFQIATVTDADSISARLQEAASARDTDNKASVLPEAMSHSRISLAPQSHQLQLLPHTHGTELHTVLNDAIGKGWQSLSVGPSMIAEFDQDAVFVSRALWSADIDPGKSTRQLWATATGNPAAADRLWQARQKLEAASQTIMKQDPLLAFLGSGSSAEQDCSLITRHFVNRPLPDWWQEVTDHYTQYMIELYRAHGAIDGDSKPVLFYYAKRGEYVLEFLAAVKAVREAALAKHAGDQELAIEQLEIALESTYNCINTLSDVARDQSDRGLIAALNACAYRPLLEKLEQLSDEE